MDFESIKARLAILGEAAKYDVSCSSSGSNRKNTKGGLGNAEAGGICHVWTANGRCISLLKVLQSNECIYDCAYCNNRCSANKTAASLSSGELARITIEFYKRNYIEGLFLSSAVKRSPDATMEEMIETIRILREEHNFNGYIHMKAIPGCDPLLVHRAGLLVDRLSVNIELPTKQSLRLLAPQKNDQTILKPIGAISSQIMGYKEQRSRIRSTPQFIPAGQTTQMIVGASPDSDYTILKLSQGLYDTYKMRRVYFSAFTNPQNGDSRLPAVAAPPLLREHRLYQADWLLRFYSFRAEEILDERNRNLSTDFDPKCDWAIRHLEQFPVEVNIADYETLLRVPGIGLTSAKRIVTARIAAPLSFDDLKKLGIVLKRAKHFITCMGKYYGVTADNDKVIRGLLLGDELKRIKEFSYDEQMNLFSLYPQLFDDNAHSAVTGLL